MPKIKRPSKKLYHPPYSKFQGYMKENRITLRDIGDLLNLSIQTVSSKNNGQADYKMGEIEAICNHYKISAEVFRTQKVS